MHYVLCIIPLVDPRPVIAHGQRHDGFRVHYGDFYFQFSLPKIIFYHSIDLFSKNFLPQNLIKNKENFQLLLRYCEKSTSSCINCILIFFIIIILSINTARNNKKLLSKNQKWNFYITKFNFNFRLQKTQFFLLIISIIILICAIWIV